MDAAAELGRNPVSKHQIQPEYGDERADARRVRPVSRDQILRHARGQGNIIFPVQLTTSRIGNLTRLIHTLLYVMTIHTYIHTTTSKDIKFSKKTPNGGIWFGLKICFFVILFVVMRAILPRSLLLLLLYC